MWILVELGLNQVNITNYLMDFYSRVKKTKTTLSPT